MLYCVIDIYLKQGHCILKIKEQVLYLFREREFEEEFSHFLEGRDALVGKKSAAMDGLSPEQVCCSFWLFQKFNRTIHCPQNCFTIINYKRN